MWICCKAKPLITMVSPSVLFALLQGAGAADFYGHVRSDVWRSDLPESGTEDPKNGRRVHVVVDGVSVDEAQLASVRVNGQDGLALTDDLSYFDWFRAHSNPITKQLWFSFHTRNADWGSRSSHDIQVTASDGSVLAQGSVSPGSDAVTLSYVTTRKGGTEVLLHLHGSTDAPVSRVLFDGEEVQLPGWLSSLPKDGHAVLTVPAAKMPGDVWTAVVFSGSSAMGYGGRILSERFPIEAWPSSSDCPLPGLNDDNAALLQGLGIDSLFYDSGKVKKCGGDFTSIVEGLATAQGGWWHLLSTGEDGGNDLAALSPAARARVDAALIGDEVDGNVDADHLRGKLSKALDLYKRFPEVPLYMGSKTNHNVGAFAGITDIQGADAYAAACAPTMLAAVNTLPLQYPYDYLRNARDNHAPLPFWGYSQLYSDAWSYQANINELITQIGQVLLSGSKAIMFFQSNVDHIQEHDQGRLKQVLQSIRRVSDIAREGDILGLPLTSSSKLNKEIMAETILSPEKLLLVVVSTNADGYNNLLCHTGIGKHWNFNDHTVKSLTLDLSKAPGVAKVSNWQEATKDGFVPLTDVTVQDAADAVEFSNMKLDSKLTVRFFVGDVTPTATVVV
jgi:hypothetical protein